jgi:citrate synthase
LRVDELEVRSVMGQVWDLDPKNISADAQFNEMPEWDSMGHVNLLVVLEDRYGLTIDFDILIGLVSIPKIVDYLNGETNVG